MSFHGPSAGGVSREAAVRQGAIMGFVDTLITFGAMIVTNSAGSTRARLNRSKQENEGEQLRSETGGQA